MTFEKWKEKYQGILNGPDVAGHTLFQMWNDAYSQGHENGVRDALGTFPARSGSQDYGAMNNGGRE